MFRGSSVGCRAYLNEYVEGVLCFLSLGDRGAAEVARERCADMREVSPPHVPGQ